MIEIRLGSLVCDEETDELGNDEPYILVVVAAAPAADNPLRLRMSDVLVYPFTNVRSGGRPAFGSIGHRFESFWGIGGLPATVTDTENAIFVAAMMENDENDPYVVRGIVDTAAAASLARNSAIARPGMVSRLIRDVDTARRTPSTGGSLVNNDDPIGDPQELRFSGDELLRADSGDTVIKTMKFAGGGGRYTVTFEAFNPALTADNDVGSGNHVGSFAKSHAISWEAKAAQLFRSRAVLATTAGFVGAFPNFYWAPRGLSFASGTVFLRDTGAEWRDVPLAELNNVALDDFEGRMKETDVYAKNKGFEGGFPNYFHADYGHGIVCGTILLKSKFAERRNVRLSDLKIASLDDIELRFKATQDYALANGFEGGFPNLFRDEKLEIDPQTGRRTRYIVCGTVLVKREVIEVLDTGAQRRIPFAQLLDV